MDGDDITPAHSSRKYLFLTDFHGKVKISSLGETQVIGNHKQNWMSMRVIHNCIDWVAGVERGALNAAQIRHDVE